jgi:hypothetical protein
MAAAVGSMRPVGESEDAAAVMACDPAMDVWRKMNPVATYEATRTAVVHAKHGRGALMPYDAGAREEVSRPIYPECRKDDDSTGPIHVTPTTDAG